MQPHLIASAIGSDTQSAGTYSRRSLHSDAEESCKRSSTGCSTPAASHLYIYFLAVYYNLYAIQSYCKTLPNITATVHRGTYFYITDIIIFI